MAADFISGDGGVDTLLGGAGQDSLSPGPGDGERANGGPGDDNIGVRSDEGGGEALDGGLGADTLNVRGTDPGPAFTTVLTVDLASGSFAAGPASTVAGMETSA